MLEQVKRPYIGVSGVTSPEVEASLETLSDTYGLTGVNRVLALGVKAVHKTQFLDIENKYGSEWYPVGENPFRNALRPHADDPDTIGVAQAYFDVDHVNDGEYRARFLSRIIQRGEPWLRAVQFDMLPWHVSDAMWDLLETTKQSGLSVFLQAHGESMSALGPKNTVKLLSQNEELIDYVLFDSSHGTGTRLDTSALGPFLAEAHDAFDLSRTGIAIAGGLNGEIVRQDLPSLVDTYPDLSWDAEGQLHPKNAAGKRPLDVEVTAAYLAASREVLSAL